MKRITSIIIFLLNGFALHAQQKDQVTITELFEDVRFLASDSLRGRGNYTQSSLQAAQYIANSFQKDSLQFFTGYEQYIIPFNPYGKLKNKWMDGNGRYDPRRVLYNVIGKLEGRSRPQEVVIFSAHFDHVGAEGDGPGDHIFNGANDNASGTAALMALARYFAKANNNERTILFCAFGGEELGLLGSKWFSLGISPGSITAMINIEMIGRTNVGGHNTFFVSGFNYSNLGEIIKKNLEGSIVKMINEPNPERLLFERSDNLPFAIRSVPAHTIMSSSDLDDCYHKPCDQWETMDYVHMRNVVEAIIMATRTILEGKETPQRIRTKVESLY